MGSTEVISTVVWSVPFKNPPGPDDFLKFISALKCEPPAKNKQHISQLFDVVQQKYNTIWIII